MPKIKFPCCSDNKVFFWSVGGGHWGVNYEVNVFIASTCTSQQVKSSLLGD